MSSLPDQIPYALVHRIEEAFVALLRAEAKLSGLEIVAASNRSATVPPLHCFVLCSRATPRNPRGPIYVADVRVVVVTNNDETSHAERRQWTERVVSTLSSVASYDYTVQVDDLEPYLHLCGWSIGEFGETSADSQTGDVIPLIVGVQTASGEAPEGGTATTV